MDKHNLNRRDFLGGLVAAAIATPTLLATSPARAADALPFAHGVASGDPLANRVIL